MPRRKRVGEETPLRIIPLDDPLRIDYSTTKWHRGLTRQPGSKFEIVEALASGITKALTGIEKPTRPDILRAVLMHHLRFFEDFTALWLTHKRCRRVPFEDGDGEFFLPPEGLDDGDKDSGLLWGLCEAWNETRGAARAATRGDEAAFWNHFHEATEGYLASLAIDSVKSRAAGLRGSATSAGRRSIADSKKRLAADYQRWKAEREQQALPVSQAIFQRSRPKAERDLEPSTFRHRLNAGRKLLGT